MLDPHQFEVNDAWIVFRLNDAPISTQRDGSFNCFALMDAASCFILSMSFVSRLAKDLSAAESEQLLNDGFIHKSTFPKTLFVPDDQSAQALTAEAEKRMVTVVRVPEEQLLTFIGPARESFAARFGGKTLQ